MPNPTRQECERLLKLSSMAGSRLTIMTRAYMAAMDLVADAVEWPKEHDRKCATRGWPPNNCDCPVRKGRTGAAIRAYNGDPNA